jgi:hypothetical protein
MTALVIDRARPETLLAAARQLYGQGKDRRVVLEAIYGVDLPDEALRFHRAYVSAELDLTIRVLTNPWQLLEPPVDDEPDEGVGPLAGGLEPAAFARAPSMIPLLVTVYSGVADGESLLGYDIDELRAGRTTIVGSRWPVDVHGTVRPVERIGASLLDVLTAIVERHCAHIAKLVADPRSGFEDDHLDDARAQLRSIQTLRDAA